VLAAAKVYGLGFSSLKFHGGQSASFVAAIAEWLAGAFTAGTPEVAFAGFNRNGVGSFLRNCWFCHRGISLKSSRDIIADSGEARILVRILMN
jgi:hypothetical protein